MTSESGLAALQSFFWSTMRDPVVLVPDIHERFHGNASLDAVQRMAIYRRMFWARQVAAVEESFPRTLAIIGAEAFRDLVRAYLLAHPSRDPRIEMLGQWLPSFLEERVAASVAREATLEWSEMAVLLQPNESEPVRLLQVAPQDVQRARLSFLNAMKFVPSPAGGGTVVWRHEFAAWRAEAQSDEWNALNAARQGEPLSVVCEAFSLAENPPARASTVLQTWLRRGWILAVTV